MCVEWGEVANILVKAAQPVLMVKDILGERLRPTREMV